MPIPGEVFYSPRAGQFYQVGRRGAVSRNRAIRFLEQDPQTGNFIDQRGRTIDRALLAPKTATAQRFTAQDIQGRTFISSETVSRRITEEIGRTSQIRSNQDVVVRTVVTTPDGRVHVFHTSGGFGRNVDPKTIKEKAASQARAALLNTKDKKGNPYKIDTPTVKNRTVRQDFYRRTIKVQGRL